MTTATPLERPSSRKVGNCLIRGGCGNSFRNNHTRRFRLSVKLGLPTAEARRPSMLPIQIRDSSGYPCIDRIGQYVVHEVD
jgi:hypothetical protein